MVGEGAAEQAVYALSLVVAIDAQVGDQQQVGLAGLDHDPCRHTVVMHVPSVRDDICLGPDRPATHRVGLGVDSDHTVGE